MSEIINDVSDTAIWVATYRARETERPDALFKDPLAKVLIGDRGARIADQMSATKYVQFSVVMRTCIIDDLIRNLVAEGVDTFVNLGAGLDTRPYRMSLPPNIRWIEVDYPHMIDFKNTRLANEKPFMRLERVKMDLSETGTRGKFFDQIASESQKIAVLTEGVVPYLTQDQVASLAKDLYRHPSFKFWITDYMSEKVYKYVLTKKRKKQMKNAPFLFFPPNWLGFFEDKGWKPRTLRSYIDEAVKHKRKVAAPWWAELLMMIFKPKPGQGPQSGYVLLERN